MVKNFTKIGEICELSITFAEYCWIIMQKREEKESRTAYDQVIKYTGLFGGVQGVNLLTSIVRNKLASLILGPAGLGIVSLYNTAVSFVGNATNLGISFSAVRHVSELYASGDEAALRRFVRVVRGWSLLAAVLGVLFCCLCSPFLSQSYFRTMAEWQTFVWLSPVVGLTALAGGELALLKAARRLRQVAVQSVINSLLALLLTVPIYWVWGSRGIVASLGLVALSTWLTTLYFSRRVFPFSPGKGGGYALAGGGQMVRLGLAFIFAGVCGSVVELVVRAYMMQVGSEAEVGLYNAGYVVTITYASMVFTAIDTEFFPRLSAVNQSVAKCNEMINRQIEITLLLISPLLTLLLLGMPLIFPLLYSYEFLPVVAMAQCAVFSLYMRAMSLPVAYLSLAKGRLWVFLFTDVVYDVVAIGLLVGGYALDGLRGTGIALSLAAVFDLVLVWSVGHFLYGYRMGAKALCMLGKQIPFGLAIFFMAFCLDGWVYYCLSTLCVSGSFLVSFHTLRRETTLLQTLRKKITDCLSRRKPR